MALTAAKCTNCGANIKVDETKEAGICEFCGTAFITEKVINNYDIKKEYLTDSDEGKILDKCIKKAERSTFVDKAKPFYLKKSSAER